MIRTTTPLAIAALLSTALAGACSKDDAAKQNNDTAGAPAAEADPGAARVADPAQPANATQRKGPTVVVTDQGAEPRQLLRFKLAKGATQKIDMTMQMAMKLDMQGMAMPETKIPATKMVMPLTVTDVFDNGDARWEMTVLSAEVVDDPSVNPMIVSAMRESMKSMTDYKGWAVITDRGFIKDADITIPPSADPQVKQLMEGTRQSLDQLTSPLPEEPVGVGARWEVSQTIEQNGMAIQQTASYVVTAIEGSVVKADVDLRQTAAPQTVNMPGLPPGVTTELLKFDTKGGGKTEVDLAKVAPGVGTITADMSMQTKVSAQGQSQMMTMDMSMKIDIKTLD